MQRKPLPPSRYWQDRVAEFVDSFQTDATVHAVAFSLRCVDVSWLPSEDQPARWQVERPDCQNRNHSCDTQPYRVRGGRFPPFCGTFVGGWRNSL